MNSDELRAAASLEASAKRAQPKSARRPQPSLTPPPPPAPAPMSPWIPFAISLVITAGAVGGVYYYLNDQFNKSIVKTNNVVVAIDKRLKVLEEKISKTDADLNQSGSSIMGKLISLEERVGSAEEQVEKNKGSAGWNSNRIGKQIKLVETLETNVNDMSSDLDTEKKTIAEHTVQLESLSEQVGTSANLKATMDNMNQRLQSNTQSIETIDAHRSRLSAAIQKVQGDTARLIRLYEKDNPSAKRVH